MSRRARPAPRALLFLLLAPACAPRPDPAALIAEGRKRLSAGQFDEAVAPLRQAASLRPETPGIFRDLGVAVLRAGNRNALLAQAEAKLKKNAEDLGALAAAATALASRDAEKQRLDYLRRLVRLRPQETDFQATLAQALVNAHLYAEARPLLETLIRVRPDDPAGYFLRGQAALGERPTPETLAGAEADFKKAIQLKPGFGPAYLNLGRVYLRRQQPQKAIESLIEAARDNPDSPEVHFELASAFQRVGNAAMAARARAQFVALRREEDLRGSLEKRCVAFPDDYELHHRTALLFLKQGDVEKSGYYVRRLVALRPDDPRTHAAAREMDTLAGEAARAGGAL